VTIAVTKAPTPPTRADEAKTAAKQLEAFFLRRLLAEARPAGGGGIDGGFAGDTFKQMLDEAVADKMAAAGGLGLADMFTKQLGQDTGPTRSITTQRGQDVGPTRSITAPVAAPAAARFGPELADAPRFAMPVIGRASSGYGMRSDPLHHTHSMHAGFDVAAKTGTPVSAAAGGVVTHAGAAGTYGNLVTIRHDSGFETRYAHLSKVGVQRGDRVTPGQEVGQVGSTGRSTGPHLHFEIRKDGKAVDPAPYLPTKSAQRSQNPGDVEK